MVGTAIGGAQNYHSHAAVVGTGRLGRTGKMQEVRVKAVHPNCGSFGEIYAAKSGNFAEETYQ